MSRFRLRFLLQEFDLPVGEVVIGRSPDCQVTIEDPLISRHHARIEVSLGQCMYFDLGSRNGSRLNGRLVTEPTLLRDSDRIRLGAQELVFFELRVDMRPTRQTGALMMCKQCATPFPEGAATCPHCGAPAPSREDETMSGLILEPRRTWMLSLLGEVLERALTTGKLTEAERILRRAAEEFNQRIEAGELVEAKYLAQLGEVAVRLALLQNDARWVRWLFDALKKTDRVPAAAVVNRLTGAMQLPGVAELATELVAQWGEHLHLLSADERSAFESLKGMLDQTPSLG